MVDYSEKVKYILQIVLKLNSIESVDDVSMDKLFNWDSMAHLSIVTGIENEFDIFIEADEAEQLTSYNNILQFLNKHPELI